MRCCIGTIGYTALVFSLLYLPISIMIIILNLSPFWTAILGYFLAGEKVSKCEIFSMFGCFIGVIILTLQAEEEDGGQTSVHKSALYMLFGMALTLLSSFSASGIIVLTRKMRELQPSVILFFNGLIPTIIFFMWLSFKYINRSQAERDRMTEAECNMSLPQMSCYNSH